MFDVKKIQDQVGRWQEKLLDISKSNPLLGVNRSRTAKLKIVEPGIFAIFKGLVLDGNELELPFIKGSPKKKQQELDLDKGEEEINQYKVINGDIDFDFTTPADLKRKIRRVYDNARTTLEERGVVTLYTTFGCVSWNDELLGESSSPILIVPCELIYKGPNAPLRLKMVDEEMIINPALIYYFKEKHKIELPTDLSNYQDFDLLALKDLFKKVEKLIAVQGWQVKDETWLGTFTFEQLVIYQDLKNLLELACQNKIIAALAHAQDGDSETTESIGDDIDLMDVPSKIPVPIFPTDSSQLKALAYSAAKSNLVIFGPPGTGKSQTISNIIADALGKNKKVLFVSAKMAALNVVYDKLNGQGLGLFCLEAHSTKAGKLKIIEDLKRTLESNGENNVVSVENELDSLIKTRNELNDYVSTINLVQTPLNISPYQAIGRYSKLNKFSNVKTDLPWEDVLSVNEASLNNCLEALSRLSRVDICGQKNDHPWNGFDNIDLSLKDQEVLEQSLESSFDSAKKIICACQEIGSFLVNYDFKIEELYKLTSVLKPLLSLELLPSNWQKRSLSDLEESSEYYKEAIKLAEEYFKIKPYYDKFTDLSLDEAEQTLRSIVSIYDTFTSRLSIAYFKHKAKVKNKLKKGIKTSYKDLQKYHNASTGLLGIAKWFNDNTLTFKDDFGSDNFINLEKLQDLSKSYDLICDLRRYLPEYDWFESSLNLKNDNFTKSLKELISLLDNGVEKLINTLMTINVYWQDGIFGESNMLEVRISKAHDKLNNLISNFKLIREWLSLRREERICEGLGLGGFIELAIGIDPSSLSQMFEKRFYYYWIDEIVSNHSCLKQFSSIKHHEIVEKFKILDEKIRRMTLVDIKANASNRLKRINDAQSIGNGSEIGILRVEMQKRKKIKPLRRLFSEIPHVLQILKPCMLMSPISVSTYLKSDLFHFDLVIFDEASQLPTQEAIASILRADQVVVAGDSNQLPPTSFFQSSLINEDDDIADEDISQASLESLLDDCISIIPVFKESPLKWHYRSRDERLISFSNHYFYENSLTTFPSCDTSSDGRGVILDYLPDGVWDRGKSRTNRKEARRVAKLVIEHYQKYPERSLGVVALNSSQREAIEDAIEEEKKDHLEMLPFFDSSRNESFFVKSLESVQGDERDVIIISIGYGKDKDNSLTMNFGPINTDGGWRRLNVLVTRAKWQIILVSSLKSSELSRVNPNNRGAYSLKCFIEYAERGGVLPSETGTLVDIETNDFEDSVRSVLKDAGYVVDAQVGAGSFRIDLAIRDPRDPSKYLIGIECDGATYHSSRVARDRDLLREQILREMGWILSRVWSTEWFYNKESAVNLLLKSVEKALDRDLSKSMPAPFKESSEELEYQFKMKPAPVAKRKYKHGIPYEKYFKRSKSEYLLKKGNTDNLSDIINELVSIEGPIHEDLLFARLKEVFRVSKVGSNINSNVLSAIRHGGLKRGKGFVWDPSKTTSNYRIPTTDVKRSMAQIDNSEIKNAILYLVEDQFGIMNEQIPQSVAKIFEVSRLASDEADKIRDVVDELVSKKILVLSGNQINLAD